MNSTLLDVIVFLKFSLDYVYIKESYNLLLFNDADNAASKPDRVTKENQKGNLTNPSG